MKAASFLRQMTQDLHRETENVSFGHEIMEGRLSMVQYRSLIAKNLFLHQQLEPRFKDHLIQYELSEFLPFLRPRVEALQADAALLSLSDENFHKLMTPDLSAANRVLGGLYVFLGSRLGGQVIYKSLKITAQLQELSNFHFYESSGKYPAKEWPQFCRLLDQYLLSESDLEEARLGAEAVFRFFRDVHVSTDLIKCRP